ISNGMVGLAGSLFAQSQGYADVTMGVGIIVVGLASVIGGEALLSTRTVVLALIACFLGALLYRLAVAFALNADFIVLESQDHNLVTAGLVAAAIVLTGLRSKINNVAGNRGGKAKSRLTIYRSGFVVVHRWKPTRCGVSPWKS